MNKKIIYHRELSQAKDKDLIYSLDAIKRAALAARQLAIETDTAIVLWENGKVVRRTAQQLLLEAGVAPSATKVNKI